MSDVVSDWVSAGAAWRASLTPLGAGSSGERERQSRVFNHSGMNPAAAARAYDRVLAQRKLTEQAGYPGSSAATLINDKSPVQPGVTSEWTPPEKKPLEQPGVTSPAPTEKKSPAQPGVTSEWTPPEYQGPSVFDVASPPPDQPDGTPWETTTQLGVATNVIVPGTGGQTIDTTITLPDNNVISMRRVADGNGGYTIWMNSSGTMSVILPEGANGVGAGNSLQYTMAPGDDPSNPTIVSILSKGGSESVSLDTRSGTIWGTEQLDNGEQEFTIPDSNSDRYSYRTNTDEMGRSYTELVGERHHDQTGWYLGIDGLHRTYNADQSVDVLGTDHAGVYRNLHIGSDKRISGWIANDSRNTYSTIILTDDGSFESIRDSSGKLLHSTSRNFRGVVTRENSYDPDGKRTSYLDHSDGTRMIYAEDGLRIHVKDPWHYTIINPDGSRQDVDTTPTEDTRSTTEKLIDSLGSYRTWIHDKVKTVGLSAFELTNIGADINLFAGQFGYEPDLPSISRSMTGDDIRLDPVSSTTLGLGIGIGAAAFGIVSADLKTQFTAASQLGKWVSGGQGFTDAVGNIWIPVQRSINARSLAVLNTDLEGSTRHPLKTSGDLAFGAATLLLPIKGFGPAVKAGATTSARNTGTAADLVNAVGKGGRRKPSNGLDASLSGRNPKDVSPVTDARGYFSLKEQSADVTNSLIEHGRNRNYALTATVEVFESVARSIRLRMLRELAEQGASALGGRVGNGGATFYSGNSRGGSGRSTPTGQMGRPSSAQPFRSGSTNGAHYSDVYRQLPGYRPPVSSFSRLLNPQDKAKLRNPFDGNGNVVTTKLEPGHRYEFHDGKNVTYVHTNSTGTPEFIDTWGSRDKDGGTTGAIKRNKILRDLQPNAVYRVNGKFWLRTDRTGLVVEAYGSGLGIVPLANRVRSASLQNAFNRMRGRISGRPLDAGHHFRNEWGSPAEMAFYSPQRSAVNQSPGAYYQMEAEVTAKMRQSVSNGGSGLAEFSLVLDYGAPPVRLPSVGRRPIGDERAPWYYHTRYRMHGDRQWEEVNSIVNR
ncbi:hypothetical protein [Nocardia lasii]|uniref:Uncharacterized protein n=1 Tax=Nocardia lasii TaxID=1616107 RepID=A0ABW1JQP7_9NOCA